MNRMKFWGIAICVMLFLWIFAPGNDDEKSDFGTVKLVDGKTRVIKNDEAIIGYTSKGDPLTIPIPRDPGHATELLIESGSVQIPIHDEHIFLDERIQEREKEEAKPVNFRIDNIKIQTIRGKLPIITGIADTPQLHMRGLMHYRSFPPGMHGVLFLFNESRPQSMWMKNTFISLDMLFIDEGGKILQIVENTQPLSTTTIASIKPAKSVLEIPAGSAKKWQISVGDTVLHPFFGQKPSR